MDSNESTNIRCLCVKPGDNVATLLADAEPGRVPVLGGEEGRVELVEPIARGHKVALRAIAEDEAVVKYGVCIGYATREIHPGQWVHLNNMRSGYDLRSSSLDVQTGTSTDIPYE
jgi:hypothetical protein